MLNTLAMVPVLRACTLQLHLRASAPIQQPRYAHGLCPSLCARNKDVLRDLTAIGTVMDPHRDTPTGEGRSNMPLWCAYDVMTLEKEGKGNIKPDYMAGAALKTLASALYAIRSNGMVWVRLSSRVEKRSNCRRWRRPSSMLKRDPVHLLPAACVASQQ